MMLNFIISIFVKLLGATYKWLEHYFIPSVLSFTKGFEFVIIITAAILFLLINVFLTLKHLKKLPKNYTIEVVDLYENKTSVEGLRLTFATYDAAESYARLYRSQYKEQYKFKVIGLRD